MTDRALTFETETTPILVAGKQLTMRTTITSMVEFQQRVEALGLTLGQPLVAQPSGDFTPETAPDPADEISTAFVVGCVVEVGDAWDPTPVPLAALATAMQRVAAIPTTGWQAIAAAALGATAAERADFLAEEPGYFGCATGALAGVIVAYGVPCPTPHVDDDLGGPDEHAEPAELDGEHPSLLAPGLELIAGTDMQQSVQAAGIWGVKLGGATYDGALPVRLAIPTAAEHVHQAALGPLATQASYYLIGRYD
ncbi:MAG: hypothetical protein M3680_04950 [Myxococcota bacterium]|nr:hypothetical protein [Myxococcota bacterium]